MTTLTRRPLILLAAGLSAIALSALVGCGGPASPGGAASTSTLTAEASATSQPATSQPATSSPVTGTAPPAPSVKPMPRKKYKNASGIPMAGSLAPPKQGAFIGAFTPPAPWEWTALRTYRAISPKEPAIVMWYQAWATKAQHEFDPASCVSAFEHGVVPLITWEPWDPGRDPNYLNDPAKQPKYRLSRIIDGTYDPYIRSWARGIRSVAGPVMLRPMHEMNGTWYPWAGTVNGNRPADYVKAWRHIHDIFVREGATNVTWVWSINGHTNPDIPANQYAEYYPGDAYVDWTATNGFNWGRSAPGQKWASFEQASSRPLAYLKTLPKPVLLVEFASVEKGGDKAAWITDAYDRVRVAHPEVRAVVYYDHLERDRTTVQDWNLGSSVSAKRAYRSAVGSWYFVSGPAPTLEAWSAELSNAQWDSLRSLPPVY